MVEPFSEAKGESVAMNESQVELGAGERDERIIELERQVKELSTLAAVSQAINSNLGTGRVLHTVLDEAVCALEAEAGTLWTIDEAQGEIVPQVAEGFAASTVLTVRLKRGEGIVGRVVESGEGELIADAQSDPRWAGRVDADTGFVTRSIVCAPLACHGNTIGCLQLINKNESRLFEESDLQLLNALGAQAALVIDNARLLERSLALANSLREAWKGTLDALTAALSTRDTDTQSHCYRTVELAVWLARKLEIPATELPSLARGALLHDIGKIGIPDMILLKPGPLTDAERQVMQQHSVLGYEMLRPIASLQDSLAVVLYHHEDYDGTGYAEGLKGDDIPRGARIFHVADVYDALTQVRPYKPAWTHEQAMAELRRFSGIRYDPEVITAMEQMTPDISDWIRELESFSPETQQLLGLGME